MYKDGQGTLSQVEIIKIHLDDELVLFYDIRMSDGKEKQTDDAHLQQQESMASVSSNNDMTMSSVSSNNDMTLPEPTSSFPSPNATAEKLKVVIDRLNGMNHEQLERVEQFINTITN